MNTKRALTALTIFEAAQPYLFWLMFSVCAHVFEDADWFSDNLPLIATVWVLATGIIGALYIWLSWNSEFRSLARNAMIIKLAHIPYYLLVFACAALSIILSLKIPFITVAVWAFCFIADATLIVTSGLYELAAVIVGVRYGRLTPAQSVMYGIAGFLFCVDVVTAIILFAQSCREPVMSVGTRAMQPPAAGSYGPGGTYGPRPMGA